MNVKQLIKYLEQFNADSVVFLDIDGHGAMFLELVTEQTSTEMEKKCGIINADHSEDEFLTVLLSPFCPFRGL